MAFDDGFTVERELAPGERLLWKGRPQTGIKFRSQDAFQIPFGLAWCGFLIFWGFGAFSKNVPRDPTGFTMAVTVLSVMVFSGFIC